ncbi:hypothetical protein PAXRUDRAFT_14997 [Paxillus rubicundulus Ve08.2h10]|uniref:Uncharacterized protein n=1 Tax=Paxillus rubicundulus Ve08.2h10 TaxID=930991 RepID=A0A0D0DQZ4_9AGAM|nr:hypothetical protein PAXRUDRAFT_14997 [Paxillus rubicundulus Ve08.2h10]
MISLGADEDTLVLHQALEKEQLKVSMAISGSNSQGQWDLTLTWFWTMDVQKDVRITAVHWGHWLRAKALKDKWEEEVELLRAEAEWTINFFDYKIPSTLQCLKNLPSEIALATQVITTVVIQGWKVEIPHTIQLLVDPEHTVASQINWYYGKITEDPGLPHPWWSDVNEQPLYNYQHLGWDKLLGLYAEFIPICPMLVLPPDMPTTRDFTEIERLDFGQGDHQGGCGDEGSHGKDSGVGGFLASWRDF